MTTRPALNVLSLLTSARWAITRDALERMMAIAEREPGELLARLRAEAEDGDDALPRFERRALLSVPASAHPASERIGVRDGVAILSVTGPLCRYASFFQEICGMTSYQQLAEDFRIAIDDAGIRAVVLHLDSPGGETNGCAELAALVHAHRGRKPIVAMVSDGAASAAYWIAAACDEIVVSPSAYVGSIGVYWEIEDWSAAEAEAGLKRWRIVSSQSPNKVPDPADAAGKAILQMEVDQWADAFVAAAAQYRGVTPDELVAAGNGGAIYIGRFAVERGLADRVATTEDLLAELTAPASLTPGTRIAAQAGQPGDTRMKKNGKGAAAAAGKGQVRALEEDEELDENGQPKGKPKGEGEDDELDENGQPKGKPKGEGDDEELDENGQPKGKPKGEGDEDDDEQTLAAARDAAVVAERARVKGILELAPRGIAKPLADAITSGESVEAAAKRFLHAMQQPGAAALAAMQGAEASIEMPTVSAGGDVAPKPGAPTIALLQQHSPNQRRRK